MEQVIRLLDRENVKLELPRPARGRCLDRKRLQAAGGWAPLVVRYGRLVSAPSRLDQRPVDRRRPAG